ncbi:MAG: DUF4179 domain-containing protein [Clostridia bacterium]|nr:DUF4179 domain-containing protein [Clostridia bacterium]MBQ4595609.1 DUF4179 domain-containing protein [Bacillota bacterium]
MKKPIRKTVIIAIAAMITLLGIAAATGSTYLFEVFGKQPLDGAEEGIVNIAAEPVVINDDITAVIDRTYYDGASIYYEITLTLAEPDKFRIFCEDQNLSLKHYTPTGEFTALDVASTLFDRFEITDEFGEEYEPTSASADQYIEHIDGGVYKLYGSYRYENDNEFALPDELELDVSLDIRYDPTEDNYDLIEPVEAVLPFSIKKSAEITPYDLTPVSQPDGWTITSADCEHSPVSDTFTFYYDFGGRFDEIWNTTFDENSSIADLQYADEQLHSNLYKFFVLDPDTGKPIETFSIGGDIENCEFFRAYVEIPAFREMPETISVQVIQKKLTDWRFGRYDGDDGMICYTEYEEVDLGVIEFQLSPGNDESELSTA